MALVTGASKGLGKAMALALGAAGADVAVVSRDVKLSEETAAAVRAHGVRAEVFPADVTDEAQVAQLPKKVAERLGPVQILVNNAGMNLRKPLVEFTLEEWHRVMNTNLTSVFLMCRAFIPQMKGRGYGRIVNMTSMMSHVSLPGRTAYSASKFGILGLIKALSLELAPEGITVNGISPGPFATEINQPIFENPEVKSFFLSRLPVGRFGRVEEIGPLAVYLCSEDAGFITGADFVIDGGWTAQ